MSDGYNGWSNYETWCVALWLDNEQDTYHHFTSRAADLVDDRRGADMTDDEIRDEASIDLAKELEEWHQEHTPANMLGVYSDLLIVALGTVNWREIAEHYCAEVDIDRPEPEEDEETE